MSEGMIWTVVVLCIMPIVYGALMIWMPRSVGLENVSRGRVYGVILMGLGVFFSVFTVYVGMSGS